MNDIIETLRESSLKYRAERKCGHMNIPYEAGQDTTIYNSTRGHKINHSFGGSNTCLYFHDSARFGIVNSIISSGGVTIPKGTELFCHYAYFYSNGPRWYRKMFKDFLQGVYASKNATVNRSKDCHFADGTSMDADQCNIYEDNIKNKLVQPTGITPESDVEDVKFISLLDGLIIDHGKKHHCIEHYQT